MVYDPYRFCPLLGLGLLVGSLFVGGLGLFWWWSTSHWLALLVSGGLVVAGSELLRASIHWKPMHQRRQIAAQGLLESELPVQPVPTSPEAVLAFPATLRHRRRWSRWIAAPGLLIVLMFVFFSGVVQVHDGALTGEGVLEAGLFALLAPVMVMRPELRQPAQVIQMTTEGLRVQQGSRVHRLRWEEACLFAIVGRGRSGTPARQYELASARARVTWIRLRPGGWWDRERPEAAWTTYDHQMETLLTSIAAVTELPLVDVRPGQRSHPTATGATPSPNG